jgi:outer membrane immunogenic protein
MKRTAFAVFAFAAIAFTSTVRAETVPHHVAAAPLVPYNWTGFYVGLNGGFGAGDTTGRILPAFFSDNHRIDGGMFGAQVGFNYQISNIVLGAEADWDWADIDGSKAASSFGGGTGTETFTIKNLGTLRARVGYTWDRILLYGTGGYAWTSRATDDCPGCGLSADTHNLDGYTLGLGVEYGITQNLSAKAEYLYVHLDPTDYYRSQGCTVNCSLGADVNVFRLGLNWRFTGLP